MKLGVVFPTTEIGNDPVAIRDYAQAAEDLGIDSLLVYDHVLGAEHARRTPPLSGPFDEESAFHEPFVLFGYLAATTSRLELATGVLILTQRQTALVAKQAAEVQILSQNRLRLGVGTGGNYVEYEALDVDYASRGKRLDEQVQLLRQLWSEPVLDYQGEFHRVDRAGIKPLPARPVPLWFGGFRPIAYRRAARIGDGFVFAIASKANCQALSDIRSQMSELGRDPTAFGAETIVDYSAGPDHWSQQAELWAQAQGTHFSVRAMDTGSEFMGVKRAGLKSPSEHISAMEQFVKAVR